MAMHKVQTTVGTSAAYAGSVPGDQKTFLFHMKMEPPQSHVCTLDDTTEIYHGFCIWRDFSSARVG